MLSKHLSLQVTSELVQGKDKRAPLFKLKCEPTAAEIPSRGSCQAATNLLTHSKRLLRTGCQVPIRNGDKHMTVTARAQTQRTPGFPGPIFIPDISIKQQSQPRVCSALVAVTESMQKRETERGSPWRMEAPVSASCKPQSPSKSTWLWAFSAAW